MIEYFELDDRKIPYKYKAGVVYVYVKSFIESYSSDTDVSLVIKRLPDMFKEIIDYKDIVIDKSSNI